MGSCAQPDFGDMYPFTWAHFIFHVRFDKKTKSLGSGVAFVFGFYLYAMGWGSCKEAAVGGRTLRRGAGVSAVVAGTPRYPPLPPSPPPPAPVAPAALCWLEYCQTQRIYWEECRVCNRVCKGLFCCIVQPFHFQVIDCKCIEQETLEVLRASRAA